MASKQELSKKVNQLMKLGSTLSLTSTSSIEIETSSIDNAFENSLELFEIQSQSSELNLQNQAKESNSNNDFDEDFFDIENDSSFSDNSIDNNLLVSESDSQDEDYLSEVKFKEDLKSLCIKRKLELEIVKDFLELLRPKHPILPKDPRTLLQTPQSIQLINVPPGEYYHFGVSSGIKYIFQSLNAKANLPHSNEINLLVCIDGLPIHKSTVKGFWPIVACIKGIPSSTFIVGLYYGPTKPSSAKEFLTPFIDEMKDLQNGLFMFGTHFIVALEYVICDTPARYFVKCIKSYNGFFGCDRCCQKGTTDYRKTINKGCTVVFLDLNAELRTNESFRNQVQQMHHHKHSPFEDLNIDMIDGFPADPMHLLFRGIGFMALKILKQGPLPFLLSQVLQGQFNAYMQHASIYLPSDFSRRPVPLQHLSLWKATLVRQFFLYLAPFVLIHINHEELLNWLMSYHIIVSLFCSPNLSTEYLEFLTKLCQSFTMETQHLFGSQAVVYSVHSLNHLVTDYKNHGNINEVSCFAFENFLRFVKPLVHSSNKPLQQAVKRVLESDQCLGHFQVSRNFEYNLKKEHESNILPANIDPQSVTQYKFLKTKVTCIAIDERDSFIQKKSATIFKIRNIIQYKNGTIKLIGQKFIQKQSYYNRIIESHKLSIFKLKKLTTSLHVISLEDVLCKFIVIPIPGAHEQWFACPLHHTANCFQA